MLKDLAIAVSLLANVVLLSLLYFSADGNIRSSHVPVEDEPVKQQLVDTVNVQTKLDVGQEPALLVCHQHCEPEDFQLMSTKLRNMKLGDEAIFRIVADMALHSLSESDGCRTLSDLESRHNTFECSDQQRRMLVSIFGSGVKENPLFESLFFPVNDTLDFLSSDEQIEVARLELERRTRLEETQFVPDKEAQHEEAIDHFARSVQELFSPEDYELYRFRRSETGRLLRSGYRLEDFYSSESLFFPVNDTLDFLSSDEQIEVARLELERRTRLEETQFVPDKEAQHEEAIDHFARSVQELFSPEDYELYRFRRSETGRLLRSGYRLEDFYSSEAEVLAVFRILEEEKESPELAEIRIKDYFGPSRYAEFQKRRDPAYAGLKSVGDRYDLNDQLVMDVYQTQIELRELSDRLEREGVPQQLIWKEIYDQLPGIRAELELRTTTEVADILIYGLYPGIEIRSYSY